MRSLSDKTFRFCAIAACSVIVANGCMLERRPIVSPGTLVPAQYCPGDTMTASYDFLRYTSGTCTPRAGVPDDCTANAPSVTMTSTPALFPTTTLPHSYSNIVTFPASGDRIDVNFAYGTGAVFIPPTTLLTTVRDNTESATRIIGAIDTTLPHMGNCARGFAVPTYAPVMVPGTSPNLGLVQVCNPASNRVSVNITIVGAGPGEVFTQTLTPGGCMSTSAPGVPAFATTARSIEVAPIGLMCGAGGDGTASPQPPAPPISTVVSQACR